MRSFMSFNCLMSPCAVSKVQTNIDRNGYSLSDGYDGKCAVHPTNPSISLVVMNYQDEMDANFKFKAGLDNIKPPRPGRGKPSAKSKQNL